MVDAFGNVGAAARVEVPLAGEMLVAGRPALDRGEAAGSVVDVMLKAPAVVGQFDDEIAAVVPIRDRPPLDAVENDRRDAAAVAVAVPVRLDVGGC
jgi:hypothetical protein